MLAIDYRSLPKVWPLLAGGPDIFQEEAGVTDKPQRKPGGD
jgi:hypothetical protein